MLLLRNILEIVFLNEMGAKLIKVDSVFARYADNQMNSGVDVDTKASQIGRCSGNCRQLRLRMRIAFRLSESGGRGRARGQGHTD